MHTFVPCSQCPRAYRTHVRVRAHTRHDTHSSAHASRSGKILPPRDQVRLDHDSENVVLAPVARAHLLRDVRRHQRLQTRHRRRCVQPQGYADFERWRSAVSHPDRVVSSTAAEESRGVSRHRGRGPKQRAVGFSLVVQCSCRVCASAPDCCDSWMSCRGSSR